jgi:hypothetical protein
MNLPPRSVHPHACKRVAAVALLLAADIVVSRRVCTDLPSPGLLDGTRM